MHRRSLLCALAAGSVAGCLRLTEQQGGGDAEQSGTTTTAAGGTRDVAGFEERWDHEDAGFGGNFRPDLVRADGDRLYAFGVRTALVNPAVPVIVGAVDVTAGEDVATDAVTAAVVGEDACYIGTQGEPPLVAELDRTANEVRGSARLSDRLEAVTDLILHDDLLFVAAGARQPSDRGRLVVGDTTTGETIAEYTWPDRYLDSLALHNDTVFLGVEGVESDDAYSISDREVFRAERRFGFDPGYNVTVTGGVLYSAFEGLTARNADTHDVVFEQDLPTLAQFPPVVRDGRVYAITSAGVRAFDAESGAEQWSVRTTDSVVSPPAFGDGVAFVSDISEIIYAIDVQTGSILYETDPFELSVGDLETIDDTLFAVINGFRALTVQYEE